MGKVDGRHYEFGPFRVDLDQRLLIRDNQPVPLQMKAFGTLLALVQGSEKVLLKEELIKTVWPDSIVEESNLAQTVFMLRKALQDTARPYHYIETLHRRGYRFIGKVKVTSESGGDLTVDEHATPAITPERPQPRLNRRPQRTVSFFLWLLGIPVFVGIVARFAWQRFHPRPRRGKSRLAVLPFENLTGDPEQEHIGDSMTEEMITQLGSLHTEGLDVIARTSVMGYKHGTKRLDEIGRELGVHYLLEGSLRGTPGQLRITVKLIQVKDQSHLWCQEYDRSAHDILARQTEIATDVADDIRLRLTPGPRSRLPVHSSEKVSARNRLTFE